jgi:hypothetical protein
VILWWNWFHGWDSMYDKNYESEKYGSEERRDIFAKYIFGWMIENMPEHLFLVKCIERLDNLMDREWLKTDEWLISYQKTVASTLGIYCKRLMTMSVEYNDIWYSLLAWLLNRETEIGIQDIQKAVREQTKEVLDKTSTST